MPEQPPRSVQKLADHIDELESLIGAARGAPAPAQVPILDDLVEAAAPEDAPVSAAEPAAAQWPVDLEQRLLRRVDAELAELGGVIREVLRHCIREELAAAGRRAPPAKEE